MTEKAGTGGRKDVLSVTGGILGKGEEHLIVELNPKERETCLSSSSIRKDWREEMKKEETMLKDLLDRLKMAA